MAGFHGSHFTPNWAVQLLNHFHIIFTFEFFAGDYDNNNNNDDDDDRNRMDGFF